MTDALPDNSQTSCQTNLTPLIAISQYQPTMGCTGGMIHYKQLTHGIAREL